MIRKYPSDGTHPPGCAEHRKEFSPDGTYGKWIVNHDARLELPTDTGKDLLRYLKQAAALDPAPSPLQKRIAELEMRLGAGAGK